MAVERAARVRVRIRRATRAAPAAGLHTCAAQSARVSDANAAACCARHSRLRRKRINLSLLKRWLSRAFIKDQPKAPFAAQSAHGADELLTGRR